MGGTPGTQGFWVDIADYNIDPERGKPDMKWICFR